jgi:rhodanese-related sulfurtransferase
LNARKLYTVTIRENKNFAKNVLKIVGGDLEAEIVVLCHSGQRSSFAGNILAKKGFENVYNLEGGFLEWKKEKKPWSVD